MKQQASESLNCVDCVDSMLKERVVFTVRTNFIYLTCRTQTFNNNKDNFITIYSICVCVCTHCVLKLLFEVRGKRFSWVHVDVPKRAFFVFRC